MAESHQDASLRRTLRAPPWTRTAELHLESLDQQSARSLPVPSFPPGPIPEVRVERELSIAADDDEERNNLIPIPSFLSYGLSPPIVRPSGGRNIGNSPSTYSPQTSIPRFRSDILYGVRTTTTEPTPSYVPSVPENDEDEYDHASGPGNPPTDPQRIFACPFYLRDPTTHRRCVKFALKRIKDVKQHLNRRHSRPDHYCPICHKVFRTSALRDSHIRGRSCHIRAPPLQTLSDGISADQRMELKRRVDRNHSAERQYMQIWETVFPGVNAPASVYLDSRASETVLIMRRVWERDGQGIIESVVTDPHSGVSTGGEAVYIMDRDLRAVVAMVLDRFLDRVQQEDGIAADIDATAAPSPSPKPKPTSHGPMPAEHDEAGSLPPHPRPFNSGELEFDNWIAYNWQLDQPPPSTD
ncbi:uncharacterized protein DNG_10302 [Cephalotrichum gorgonifer]|uniref:C2H2-type domain-containing protein n=1 Tax=Cephalotrichum gorgonifer TaxID=2041049 RepID=A0AAE8T0L4_9PEZI|nr:uncharacterized protein DNG_10302 [Cephalotrichum gorgonifer]